MAAEGFAFDGRGARRSRSRRPPHDAARGGRDAVLHARRHQGDGQGRGASRAARARRADRPRQHLPPVLPPRHGDRRRARRPARLHAVGRADPHGLGRLPGLQPGGHAPHARRRRGVQLGLRRLAPRVHARAGDAHPGGARRRRHHGVRPVRAGHAAARGARGRRGAHHALGGGLQGGARPPRPAPHRDRAGRRRTRRCGGGRPPRSSASASTPTPSAASASASAATRCSPPSSSWTSCCRPTGCATSWASATPSASST